MTVEEYNKAVDDYSDGLYRFILKNMKQEDRAQDIVQDTFEKLWVKKDSVEGEKVKTYLFTTAYHTMIDAIRKEKRMDDVEYIQENKHFHHQQYSDLNEILEKALNKIPEHQKRIILLRDYEGYSYKEIGEIAGMTEPQVKINIYRGRLALKEYLKSVETLV